MGMFRKKPVVIEARCFDSKIETYTSLIEWCGGRGGSFEHPNGFSYPAIFIPTLEGGMMACPGDWIIRGVKGEFYPCKPNVFEATYEPADGPILMEA